MNREEYYRYKYRKYKLKYLRYLEKQTGGAAMATMVTKRKGKKLEKKDEMELYQIIAKLREIKFQLSNRTLIDVTTKGLNEADAYILQEISDLIKRAIKALTRAIQYINRASKEFGSGVSAAKEEEEASYDDILGFLNLGLTPLIGSSIQ